MAAELVESPKEREDEDSDKDDGDSFWENVRLSFYLKKKVFFLTADVTQWSFFLSWKKKEYMD